MPDLPATRVFWRAKASVKKRPPVAAAINAMNKAETCSLDFMGSPLLDGFEVLFEMNYPTGRHLGPVFGQFSFSQLRFATAAPTRTALVECRYSLYKKTALT